MFSKVKQMGAVAALTLSLGMAAGFSMAGPLQTVQGQTAMDSQTALLHNLYAKANPSVVSIDVRLPATSANSNPFGGGRGQQSPFGQPQTAPQQYSYAAGSGFLYDSAGDIVTNAHVVQGADKVEVTFSDNTQFHATVVGIDLDSDIAVIKVQGDTSKYQPLQLANSDQVTIGDLAVAIGNPFEEAGTMTKGIVSGVHRSVDGLAAASTSQNYQIPDAIQTDAALNPGNSGGPLLNENAQVIGVNEQIASQVRQSSGVSFAIPSNLVKLVADALIKSGKIEHSWLGISGTTLTLDATESLKLPANTHGAYVEAVASNSPAAKSGLKGASQSATIANQDTIPAGGDIIIAVDKQPVTRFDDLTSYLFAKTTVGQTITLTVLRDGKTIDLSVTTTARPHTSQPAN